MKENIKNYMKLHAPPSFKGQGYFENKIPHKNLSLFLNACFQLSLLGYWEEIEDCLVTAQGSPQSSKDALQVGLEKESILFPNLLAFPS